MSFKNKWREARRNSKYRLAVIGILFVAAAALWYFAKNGTIKAIAIGIMALLGIAGVMETTNHDYDVQKLIETKSFKDSKIEKTEDGHWKINDVKCQKEAINCKNFKTQKEAQDMFEYCGGKTDDIYGLDRDKDGKACEALPLK